MSAPAKPERVRVEVAPADNAPYLLIQLVEGRWTIRHNCAGFQRLGEAYLALTQGLRSEWRRHQQAVGHEQSWTTRRGKQVTP